MTALMRQAETGPIVFRRLDGGGQAVSRYLLGVDGALRLWEPTPTTAAAAGVIYDVGEVRGAFLPRSLGAHKPTREALMRVVRQIAMVSQELGQLLREELKVISTPDGIRVGLRRTERTVRLTLETGPLLELPALGDHAVVHVGVANF